METDWELEDWILEEGERIETKRLAEGDVSLSEIERLTREVWGFDIETLNGGVSQYFGNNGLRQWDEMRNAWLRHPGKSLGPIIAEVERVIAGADDPCRATFEASPYIEDFYYAHRMSLLAELRAAGSAA